MIQEDAIHLRYDVYKLGVEPIDNDHFRMLTLADSARKTLDKSLLVQIFDELIQVMNEHIEREEGIIKETTYPFVFHHCKTHDDLRKQVADAYKYIIESSLLSFGKYNPVSALTQVLLTHFDSYDRQFVEYYQKQPR